MYNVLIADDDVDAWFQVNALLRRHFLKASFVTNLAAAKQYVEQKIPSLLFFDKQLQDNSTLDFIKYVRSKFPEIKIIMINAHGEGSPGFRSRADLVLSKPLIPEIVERAIVNLLSPGKQSFRPSFVH